MYTEKELLQRILQFDIDVHNYLLRLPQNNVYAATTSELIDSSSYLGRYYEEVSRKVGIKTTSDFIWSIGIVLTNIQKCNYKLRTLSTIVPDANNNKELKRLLNETDELKNIFTSIKETSERELKNEDKIKLMPHVGKISFLGVLVFGYLYSLTENGFIVLLFLIFGLILLGRIYNLLFSNWEAK